MFVIDKNNKIKLTVGDTATMLIQIFDLDNNEYQVQEDDTITLTLKKTADSEIVLEKTATKDNYIIIESSDTSNLKAGLYVYDVQLRTGSDFVYTIIPTSFFQLTSEVSV